MNSLVFLCDNHRHMVCLPYSKRNLHRMARKLKVKRYWFHKNHYDMPKRRIEELKEKCIVTSSKNLVRIIKGEITQWPQQEKTLIVG